VIVYPTRIAEPSSIDIPETKQVDKGTELGDDPRENHGNEKNMDMLIDLEHP